MDSKKRKYEEVALSTGSPPERNWRKLVGHMRPYKQHRPTAPFQADDKPLYRITNVKSEPEEKSDMFLEPEFIITEKDLESDEEQEEFFFLEGVRSTSKVTKVADTSREEQSQQMLYPPIFEEEVEVTDCHEETETEQQIEQPEAQESASSVAENEADNEQEEEAKKVQPTETDNTETGAVNTIKVEVPTEKAAKTEPVNETEEAEEYITHTDVCDDTFFGELVATMLKRLPAERKRAIKKDIMNLLLA